MVRLTKMKRFPFKGRVWKQGGSYVVTVPSDYVNNGLVPEDRELQFSVEVAE